MMEMLPAELLEYVPFIAYGLPHCVVLVLFVLVATGLVVAARSGGEQRKLRIGKCLAFVILGVMLPFQIGAMSPSFWSIHHSLPFQLCDLAWMVAVVALLARAGPVKHVASDLLFYWGLTLTVQGLITPALHYGFPHIAFFMFFLLHCLVVWAAIYLIWGLGYRPTWRGYWRTVTITVGWMVLMLGFNSLFSTNYLFVSEKPATASVLDALGPWPIYLFWEVAIGMAVWAILTLLGKLGRRHTHQLG